MTRRIHKETPAASPIKDTPPVFETTKQPAGMPLVRPTMKIGRLFWGLLLIVVGGLVLLNNFGVVVVDWTNVWKLWPLGIIAAGLSILSVRNWLWRTLAIAVMVVTLGLIVYLAVFAPSTPTPIRGVSDVTIERQSATISRADVAIKTGASQLQLTSADHSTIARSRLESNVLTQSHTSSVDGGIQRVSLSTEGGGSWWIGDGLRTNWQVSLTRGLPLDVSVDIGATDADIDLSKAFIQSIDVNSGASSVVVKIGALEKLTRITIDSGASSVVVKVPKSSGVQVRLDSGLASKNLADLKETTTDVFESDGFDSAAQQVTIVGKIGASSFTVERY